MAWNYGLSACLFFLYTGLATSAFISDVVFQSRGPASRTLLQPIKECSVNFENLNYTVLTSQCKGPQYPAKLCCAAFKEFACAYADDISDLTNNCAATMFSYINLYGKYPPGLFASECREGKEGLECPTPAPTESVADASRGLIFQTLSPFLVLSVGFLVLLF